MDDPVKVTTLRRYIKERTRLRVEKWAVEILAKEMNALAQRVVDRAGALVAMQEQLTIQAEDIQRAIADVKEASAAGTKPTPEAVFQLIEDYTLEELGALARRIEQSLEV